MQIIKCDICGKESNTRINQESIGTMIIDVCNECFPKLNQCKNDFRKSEDRLCEEYNKKHESLYKDFIKKINLKEKEF